jgi:hypothetical protein
MKAIYRFHTPDDRTRFEEALGQMVTKYELTPIQSDELRIMLTPVKGGNSFVLVETENTSHNIEAVTLESLRLDEHLIAIISTGRTGPA